MATQNSTPTPQNTRAAELEALYVEAFPAVAGFISKRGGSLEEAKDIFQDTLVLYMEKSRDGLLPGHIPSAYLFGIAKNLWYHRFSDIQQLYDHERPKNPLAADMEDQGAVALPQLLRLLQKAGEKCVELLQAFYYEKADMEALASRFGFSGARSATVQKYKCLEKIKETVKTKALQYEDFLE